MELAATGHISFLRSRLAASLSGCGSFDVKLRTMDGGVVSVDRLLFSLLQPELGSAPHLAAERDLVVSLPEVSTNELMQTITSMVGDRVGDRGPNTHSIPPHWDLTSPGPAGDRAPGPWLRTKNGTGAKVMLPVRNYVMDETDFMDYDVELEVNRDNTDYESELEGSGEEVGDEEVVQGAMNEAIVEEIVETEVVVKGSKRSKRKRKPRRISNDTLIECPTCRKIVPNKNFHRHAELHDADTVTIQCPVAGCIYTTTSQSNMDRHAESGVRFCPRVLFVCQKCFKLSKSEAGLRHHQSKKCLKKYPCTNESPCTERFQKISDAKAHSKLPHE